MGRLHWNATARGWFGSNEQMSVFVREESYEQHLKAYLLAQGVEYKSHDEYLQPGEEAWQKQCEVVRAFQAHLDYWLAHQGIDVKVHCWEKEAK
jgi:G:T-mismatch repair DNA endonuclease (very short patch repair protein)